MTDQDYIANLIEIKQHMAASAERWRSVDNRLGKLNNTVQHNAEDIDGLQQQAASTRTWVRLIGGAVGFSVTAGGIIGLVLQFVV